MKKYDQSRAEYGIHYEYTWNGEGTAIRIAYIFMGVLYVTAGIVGISSGRDKSASKSANNFQLAVQIIQILLGLFILAIGIFYNGKDLCGTGPGGWTGLNTPPPKYAFANTTDDSFDSDEEGTPGVQQKWMNPRDKGFWHRPGELWEDWKKKNK